MGIETIALAALPTAREDGDITFVREAGQPPRAYVWSASGAEWQPIRPALSGVKVTKNASQTLSNNTETALTWPSEEWDTDAYHDTSVNTDRLVAPAAGKYSVSAIVGFAADPDGARHVFLRLNGIAGTLLARVTLNNAGAVNAHIPLYAEVELAAADFVLVTATHVAGANLDVLSGTTMATMRRID